MGSMKQLSTKDNVGDMALKRANTQHPKSKAFLLAQVPADEQMIVAIAETEFASEMYVIDAESDIPEHIPTETKTTIQLWLKENKFEERDDDVCIISPFIPNLRGFIVELFDRSYAEKYSHTIASQSNVKVKGLFAIIDDLENDEFENTSLSDSSLNQKVQELKHSEEDENRQAVEKAKIINNRLW